jgi:hypothetical protein
VRRTLLGGSPPRPPSTARHPNALPPPESGARLNTGSAFSRADGSNPIAAAADLSAYWARWRRLASVRVAGVAGNRRRIKNQRLAATGYLWAFSALNASPGARAPYDRRKTTGDHHAGAQRNLFNRLTGILYHCLQTRQTYNEHVAFPTTTPTQQLDKLRAWDVSPQGYHTTAQEQSRMMHAPVPSRTAPGAAARSGGALSTGCPTRRRRRRSWPAPRQARRRGGIPACPSCPAPRNHSIPPRTKVSARQPRRLVGSNE